jgi:hypothetical protein
VRDDEATSGGDEATSGEPLEPPGDSHPAAYRSMLDESRAVLDHQIEFLNQMDDAALRTVRTAVIVIGIVVSAASLGSGDRLGTLGSGSVGLAIGGICSLLFSIVLGVYTFRRSNATLGPSEDFALEVRHEEYDESEWYDLLLQGYHEWHGEMRTELAENAMHLYAVQGLLLLGMLLLTASVALIIVPL